MSSRGDRLDDKLNQRLIHALMSGPNAVPESHGIESSRGLDGELGGSVIKRLQQLEKEAKAKNATIQQLRMDNEGLAKKARELEDELIALRLQAGGEVEVRVGACVLF